MVMLIVKKSYLNKTGKSTDIVIEDNENGRKR